MLQGLTQRRVKGQIGPDNVLLNPHVRAQPFDLLPQAVQIFLLGMRVVRLEHSQRVVMRLLPALRDIYYLQSPPHTEKWKSFS